MLIIHSNKYEQENFSKKYKTRETSITNLIYPSFNINNYQYLMYHQCFISTSILTLQPHSFEGHSRKHMISFLNIFVCISKRSHFQKIYHNTVIIPKKIKLLKLNQILFSSLETNSILLSISISLYLHHYVAKSVIKHSDSRSGGALGSKELLHLKLANSLCHRSSAG